MTQFEVEVLPEAEAEIREAFLWYFERSPIAADAFRTEAVETIDRLATHATMWSEDDEMLRRYILRHFPYTVIYDVRGQTVTVLAVAHHRRRPRYWRER